MSTKSIVLTIILLTIPIYPMKRNHSNHKIIKQQSMQSLSFYIPDIENILTNQMLQHPLLKKPRETTQIINTLSKVNKNFNLTINDPEFTQKLINNLASTLYCSHETIARLLSTQQAKKRLNLQLELKQLCCTYYTHPWRFKTQQANALHLNQLIKKGIDLEFTYNHKGQQKTAFMIATDYSNGIFDLLFDKVNINTCNNCGMTALKYSLVPTIRPLYIIKLIAASNDSINQKNKHGETALLRTLIYRQNNPVTDLFLLAIAQLLDAGADPKAEMKKDGKTITPLSAAQQLNDERITNLIEQAIEKKHSNS